jgi:hypothetical protein
MNFLWTNFPGFLAYVQYTVSYGEMGHGESDSTPSADIFLT